jgi:OOP family OmpA-OmpF porin
MTDPVVTDESVTDLPADTLDDCSAESQPDRGPQSVGAQSAATTTSPPPSPLERLNELRQLLFGSEQQQLRQLQHRLDDPHQHATEVSRVLPGAIRLRTQQDQQLTTALMPTVEDSIASSVRTNPKKLSDALYPIVGPAIRAAVAHTLGSMIQSLNETLNRSFSWQGFRWRLEAWRTGKQFAEVVLLHTLLYRVEQVFLIHRETGLLLEQVVAPAVAAQDPQLVSGMLTAIQDFIRDSFAMQQGESLATLEMGPLQVWTEQGPEAVLAAVIRGEAPEDLRGLLQEVLERIHLTHAVELSDFNGDAALFEASRPELERCLQSQLAAETARKQQTKISPVLIAIPLLLLLLLGWWIFAEWRDARRWNDYISRLKAEPGIVVVEAERRGGQYFVSGLRDPLAADPVAVLKTSPLEAQRVVGRWQPYQDLSPHFVEARARALLQPPRDVSLKLEDGFLIASGPVPLAWAETAAQQARFLPGASGLRIDHSAQDALIASTVFHFLAASTELTPDQNSEPGQVAEALRLISLAATLRRADCSLQLTGNTDGTGPEAMNQKLRRQRAEKIASLLRAHGVEMPVKILEGQDNSRSVMLRVRSDR